MADKKKRKEVNGKDKEDESGENTEPEEKLKAEEKEKTPKKPEPPKGPAADEGERPVGDVAKYDNADGPPLRVVVKRVDETGCRGLLKEFYQLKKTTNIMAGRTEKIFSTNMRKNRYKDVGCWDQTRVKLKGMSGLKGDYIHGNWVDGYGKLGRYILTQGPMKDVQGHDDTTGDFWGMVWEQRVCVVIMLCQTVEQGKSKCAEYWPKETGQAALHGQFSVMCKDTGTRHIADHSIILNQLILTPIGGNIVGSREVAHYVHCNWPDRKCPPSAKPIVDFLLKIRAVHTHMTEKAGIEQDKSPMVVHCSAGIGRSGTLVAIDVALELVDRPNPTLDVPNIVRLVRLARRFAVQTPIQYVCIYQAIIEYLNREKRLTRFDLNKFNMEVVAFA